MEVHVEGFTSLSTSYSIVGSDYRCTQEHITNDIKLEKITEINPEEQNRLYKICGKLNGNTLETDEFAIMSSASFRKDGETYLIGDTLTLTVREYDSRGDLRRIHPDTITIRPEPKNS